MPRVRPYLKGWRAEDRLVKLLRQRGLLAARLPRSGKAPYSFDVIAVRRGDYESLVFLIEVKMRKARGALYLEKDKVQRIDALAERVNAIPVVALYVSGERSWYARDINSYDKATGKYYVYEDNDKWRPLDEYMAGR